MIKPLAWLLFGCAALGAAGPLPLPPLPTTKLAFNSSRLAVSPKAAAQKAVAGKPMVEPLVVLPPTPKIVTLAADYAPTRLTNLVAIMEVRTNLKTGAWLRVGQLPYPTNGGTFKVPYTNVTKEFYFRAGYVVPNSQ